MFTYSGGRPKVQTDQNVDDGTDNVISDTNNQFMIIYASKQKGKGGTKINLLREAKGFKFWNKETRDTIPHLGSLIKLCRCAGGF